MKRTNTAVWMEKQKRWQIKVQKDGERRSFYSSTPGRTGQREANAKADAWLDDNVQNTTQRVKELYDQYIEEKKMTTSKSNWDKLERYGRNWIIPAIGHRKISTITDNDYQKIINQMFTEGKAKKTILCLRATITEFAKFCRRLRVSTLNPEFLTIPNGAPVKEKIILQKDDIKILFSSDKTIYKGREIEDPFIYAYRFQVLTGLRPGELIGLKWEDIWDDIVHIRRAINMYGEETKGKNENAIRNFGLIAPAKKVLQNQWAKTGKNGGKIFPIEHEKQYRNKLIIYCRYNGLPEVSPYMLRHTFVSAIKQLPEGIIKSLVGHSEDMDTLGIYSHELTDDISQTVSEVEKVFGQILGSGL